MTEIQTKQIHIQIQKAEGPDHDAVFIMSAGSPDRMSDTIDPKAYTPNLGKSLIALWQHNADQVVGYWKDMEVRGEQLVGRFKSASTDLGRMVKQLLDDGVPLGASIGFRGAGEPNEKGGIHFKQVELLETSIVSVPCHPGAIQIAKDFGIDPSTVVDADEPVSGQSVDQVIRKANLAVIAAKKVVRK